MRNLEELKQIAVGVHKLFGQYCEVVIHDFSDLEHSIIHIEGNVTGRSVGGAATNLLLACVRNNDTAQDLYNYQTELHNGRKMRSCTMFLRDEFGKTYGAFCINFDITAFTGFHTFLDNFLLSEESPDVSETFSDDMQGTIHTILMETIGEMEVEQPLLSREEKIHLIARLDEKGIFQVKKSVPILAEELGLSRSTVYNYLSEAREERTTNISNNRIAHE